MPVCHHLILSYGVFDCLDSPQGPEKLTHFSWTHRENPTTSVFDWNREYISRTNLFSRSIWVFLVWSKNHSPRREVGEYSGRITLILSVIFSVSTSLDMIIWFFAWWSVFLLFHQGNLDFVFYFIKPISISSSSSSRSRWILESENRVVVVSGVF